MAPSGSANPSIIVGPNNGVASQSTFTRNGVCSLGFAWSEATLWIPNGGDTVLGNQYVNPYSQTVNVGNGFGVYWIQFRLVDIDYNYVDQWIEIDSNLTFNLDLRDTSFWNLSFDGLSADHSLSSVKFYWNGILQASATGTATLMQFSGITGGPQTNGTLVLIDGTGTHTVPIVAPYHY